MEVHLRLKKGVYDEVSEQDILDCSTATHGNSGCDGGNTMKAFRYIKENGFVTKREAYPYENKVSSAKIVFAHVMAILRRALHPLQDEVFVELIER